MAAFVMRLDLRNPSFAGVSGADRYEAALEMAAWADRQGFAYVFLSEHHGWPDGYLPSALPLAAAIAARTDRIRIQIAAIVAPFHDPLRLAEDAAVVDLVAKGRLELVLANGYVADEFEMFGVPMGERVARTVEAVRVLQAAATGAPFEHRGRQVRVTPAPFRAEGVRLLLGGSSEAAARRAARLGIGFRPSTGAVWDAYRDECIRRGRSDPGPYLGGDATVTFLALDVEEGWAALAPYALHDAGAYGGWATAAGVTTGYRAVSSVAELRDSGQCRVLTPAMLLDELARAGPAGFAVLHPMLGGLPPSAAWASLRLLEHEVLPHL